MTTEDKERIDRESSRYAQGFSTNGFRLRMAGYVAGSVAEHEHMAEQVKQERNKAIEDFKQRLKSRIITWNASTQEEVPSYSYKDIFELIDTLIAHGEH